MDDTGRLPSRGPNLQNILVHTELGQQIRSAFIPPLERTVLDQLVGTMQNVGADQGLLVCWGGFKKTIIDEDLRAELPLKRIWTVASAEEEEKE